MNFTCSIDVFIVLSDFFKGILHGLLALSLKPHAFSLFSHLNTRFQGFLVGCLIWGVSLILRSGLEEAAYGGQGSLVKGFSEDWICFLAVIAVCWIIRLVQFVSAKFFRLSDHFGVFCSLGLRHFFDGSLHLDNLFLNIVNHFFNLRVYLTQNCCRLLESILILRLFQRTSLVGLVLDC